MAEDEDEHWWFVGRRALIARVIETLDLPHQATILEIGAGTGGNLSLLKRYGQVQALEPDPGARKWATCKTGIAVADGCLPDGLPVGGLFDLVCLFDVLEHVQHDVAALEAIRPLLKPTSRILITVPAHQWMWSPHDLHHHHIRRYSRYWLNNKVTAAGYRVIRISYFNSFLFPLAVLSRIVDRLLQREVSTGLPMPSRLINKMLSLIFSAEAILANRISLPIGLSLLAVLEDASPSYSDFELKSRYQTAPKSRNDRSALSVNRVRARKAS